MNVDLAISLSIFFIFLAIVVAYIVNTYSQIPNLKKIASFREESVKFMKSLLSEGTPSNWASKKIAPTSLGIEAKTYRVPIVIEERSGFDRINSPVHAHVIADSNCQRICWNTTLRLYDSNLNEIPFKAFNKIYCSSGYLKEFDLFFLVNISGNSSKMFYLFFSNNTGIKAKNYTFHLKAWWTFDEGTGGVAYDWSGHNNTGVLKDANSTNGDGDTPPQWVEGKFGKALSFDGVDDYVEVNNSEARVFNASEPFTVCTWIKPNSDPLTQNHHYTVIGEWQIVFGYKIYNSTNNYLALEGSWNNTGWDGAKYILDEPLENKWFNFCGIYDGENISLYLDGNKLSELEDVGSNTREIKNIHIGAWLYPDIDDFNGTIDEVRIYDKVLSSDEVATLNNSEPLFVKVFPPSTIDIISSEKLNALRNITYSKLKQTLGTNYDFRIEIEPG